MSTPDDLTKELAKALVKKALVRFQTGDMCIYCKEPGFHYNEFPHKSDCPVAKALEYLKQNP